jgi:Zn-dependent protease with chaperone function
MAPAKANPQRHTRPACPTASRVAPRPATQSRALAPAPARPAFGHARVKAPVRLAAAAPILLFVAGVALAAAGVFGLAGTAVCAALGAIGCAVGVGNRHYGSTERLRRTFAGRRVHPAGEARLVNLVESLCFGFGLRTPDVVVIEDPAPNALTLGRTARAATLVVTNGALELFDRMQLEAVLAHELAHLKRGDTAAAAGAMRAFGLAARLGPRGTHLARRGVAPDREVRADLAAVSVTRYPPALADALDALARAPSTEPRNLAPLVARVTAWQWCAPFTRSSDRFRPGDLDLALRIAALREL